MNIFRFELKQGWKSAVAWSLGLTAIAALYISIFPSLSSSSPETIQSLMANFPPAFKKAFDISDNYLTLFPSMYTVLLNLVVLAGSIQAMSLGTGIVSKEIRNNTADFLLTKPVSRWSVESQKLLAAIVLLLLTNVVFFAAAWGLIQAIIDDPFSFRTFLTCTLVLPLVQVFFLAFGFLLGSSLPKVRSVIAVALPAVFGFYVLGLFDTIVGEDKIKYLTPFKFFDISDLAAGGSYTTESLVYLAAIMVVFITAGFIIYRKRDIHSV